MLSLYQTLAVLSRLFLENSILTLILSPNIA
nr:MAG TPA: hypothetical protein [Caudoviricetes sp.]